jgi:hypothetical protein
MDDIGLLDERYDEVDDITRVRRLPSLQIVGYATADDTRLNALTANRRSPRRPVCRDQRRTAQFSGSLRNACAMADLKLGRLLDTIDEWATDHGLDAELEPPRVRSRRRSRRSPPLVSISPAATSAPSSGRLDTARTTPGCRHRPRPQRDDPPRRGSGRRFTGHVPAGNAASSAGGSRRSSTARVRTPTSSVPTSRPTSNSPLSETRLAHASPDQPVRALLKGPGFSAQHRCPPMPSGCTTTT